MDQLLIDLKELNNIMWIIRTLGISACYQFLHAYRIRLSIIIGLWVQYWNVCPHIWNSRVDCLHALVTKTGSHGRDYSFAEVLFSFVIFLPFSTVRADQTGHNQTKRRYLKHTKWVISKLITYHPCSKFMWFECVLSSYIYFGGQL